MQRSLNYTCLLMIECCRRKLHVPRAVVLSGLRLAPAGPFSHCGASEGMASSSPPIQQGQHVAPRDPQTDVLYSHRAIQLSGIGVKPRRTLQPVKAERSTSAQCAEFQGSLAVRKGYPHLSASDAQRRANAVALCCAAQLGKLSRGELS